MFKKIKKFLGITTVEWVDNTHINYPHLESKEYLLVYSSDEGSLLFSPSQVKRAKKRAETQKEDS
jgi:hypothetical protein